MQELSLRRLSRARLDEIRREVAAGSAASVGAAFAELERLYAELERLYAMIAAGTLVLRLSVATSASLDRTVTVKSGPPA